MIYRPDTGEILGVHILGLHAADLIHEASNAIAMGNTIKVNTILKDPFSQIFAIYYTALLTLNC